MVFPYSNLIATSDGHVAGLTFAAALVLGVFFVILAHKMRVSAIVVLLIGGILVGPQVMGKYAIIDPDNLQNGLSSIIALAVGIILFEGGLSLDPRGYREASREIKGILTVGVLATWGATALLIHFARPESDWSFCLLAASLIIVTGPTVIGPLLKRIRVKKKIHHILHWEGVLIDPIGVFLALLCYEIVTLPGNSGTQDAFIHFGARIVIGIVFGVVGGFILTQIIKRKWVPEDQLNIFVLAMAIGIYAASDAIEYESGLLSVTIAGFFVGYMDLPEVRKLRTYKAELIELLIGLLFVLLAANLDLKRFTELGWPGLMVVLAVMFLVRPLNIFLSTMGSTMTRREKLFLSWIGPRGIVAASMASLFALTLDKKDHDGAVFLEAFTYSVIAGTVLFQGFTAGFVGKLLGVLEPSPTGWLVVGSHRLGRTIAEFLQKHGAYAVLIDNNPRSYALARRAKLPAICEDALTVDTETTPELYGIGNVLAVTESDDLNSRVCVRFRNEADNMTLYRWSPHHEDRKIKDSDLVAGESIWDVLQHSLLLAYEMGEGGTLEELTVNASELRHPERVLMCEHNGQFTPYLPKDVEGECAVLMYQPFGLALDLNMKPHWLVYSKADSMPQLFEEMLNCLVADYPDLSVSEIRKNLIKQENEYSSLVGYGVALPHFHLDELKESVVIVAKLDNPLKDQHSGEPIRYVFLVLSPSDQPRAHLNSLSEISRFIMEEQNRERLEDVKTLNDLNRIFFP